MKYFTNLLKLLFLGSLSFFLLICLVIYFGGDKGTTNGAQYVSLFFIIMTPILIFLLFYKWYIKNKNLNKHISANKNVLTTVKNDAHHETPIFRYTSIILKVFFVCSLLVWLCLCFLYSIDNTIINVWVLISAPFLLGFLFYQYRCWCNGVQPFSFFDAIKIKFKSPKQQITKKNIYSGNTVFNKESVTTISSQVCLNKSYVMKNGESLIWEGSTKSVSLKLEYDANKKYGIFTSLVIRENGEFYLFLTDPESGECLEIKESDIALPIIVGSTRYDFVELCRKVFKLDLHEVFEYAKTIRICAKEIKTIATFPPISTTFTYLSKSGKNKRTVDITEYKKNNFGDEYIFGYCHLRKELRTFAVYNIQTMMHSQGYKKYYFNDWLKNVAGVNIDGN